MGNPLLKFEVAENKFWRFCFMIIRIVWGVKRLFIVWFMNDDVFKKTGNA